MENSQNGMAHYHLPGLFEFYELYRAFLPLFREHREYFYDWCDIGSIYGAPADCIWGGGRVGVGDADPQEVLALMQEYGISARLTFSNSLLRKEHLSDKQCNRLCALFNETGGNGVIVHSDLLLEYLKKNYSNLYLDLLPRKVRVGKCRLHITCGSIGADHGNSRGICLEHRQVRIVGRTYILVSEHTP